MTDQYGRTHLSAAGLDVLLSHVKTRADSARKKGTTRAVVDELIILLLVKAGLRPNELCGLKIGDLSGTNGQMALGIRDTNVGVTRKINIAEDLALRLVRFVDLHRNRAQTTDPLLESERGTPLSYMSLYSRVRRIGRETGIAQLSPAALRQAYVQQLYEATGDLRYVQQQAGYASRRSMARYIKSNGDPVSRNVDHVKKRDRTAIEPRALDPSRMTTCEACGTIIPAGGGKRIESGQLLCEGCLKYFRRA